jgi:hypothetical protein
MLITIFAAIGRARRNMLDLPSWQSRSSFGSAYSFLSLGSLFSAGSVLSIGSAGSILSIGSAGSILSIGSAGSILSIGAKGSAMSLGQAPDLKRAAALQEELAEDISRISARLRARAKRIGTSRVRDMLRSALQEVGR